MPDLPPYAVLLAACREDLDPLRPVSDVAAGLLAARALLGRDPEVVSVLVVTDVPALARELAPAGADVVLAPDTVEPETPLPWGIAEGLPELERRLGGPDTPCLVVGLPEARTLDADVARLKRQWRDGAARIVVSLSRPDDPPCQVQGYFRMRGVGFLHAFEDGEAAASWRAKGFYPSRTFAALPYLGTGDVADGARVVTEDGRMRVLFTARELDAWLTGLGFPGPATPAGAVAFGSGAPIRLLLFTSQGRSYLAASDPEGRPVTLALELAQGREVAILPYRLDPGRWAQLPGPVAGLGLFYSLLGEPEAGQYDIALDLPVLDAPWCRTDGVLTVRATGKPIYGRQNFPECHRIDGRYAWGRIADLGRFSALLAQGLVQGLCL